MNARTTLTLALAMATGCNYDYSIIVGDSPPAAIPSSSAVDWDIAVSNAPGEDTDGEAIIEDTAAGDTDGDAPAPVDVDTDAAGPLDTGSAADSDPPADTDVADTGSDTGASVDAGLPVDTDVPPPDPIPDPLPDPTPAPDPVACDVGLPLAWEVKNLDGGRESMVSHVGDWDGDGNLDVAWVNQLDTNVRVLWGEAGGPRGTWSTFSIGRSEGYIDWGDLNEDGFVDLIASNQDAGAIRLSTGSAVRTVAGSRSDSLDGFPQRVHLVDANGDGHLDALVGLGRMDKTVILAGDGRGGWGSPVDFAEGSGQMRHGDLDGDGTDEIIQTGTGRILTLGGMPWTQPSLSLDATESDLGQVWVVDLDGDGMEDVAASVKAADGTRRVAAWVLGDDGTLQRCGTSGALPAGVDPTGLGDLDGDGLVDYTWQKTCSYCSSTYSIGWGRP